MASYLGITILASVLISGTSWWIAVHQTQKQVDARLEAIIASVSSSTYPLTSAVMESISELTGSELALVDEDGNWIDGTLPRGVEGKALFLREELMKLPVRNRLRIDHVFEGTGVSRYYAGWAESAPHDLRLRSRGIAWIGIFIPHSTVRQLRWQAVALPMVTGIATAIGLGFIAIALTNRVVRRIQRIQQKVHRITQGDYEPIEWSKESDELSDLSISVNSMAKELGQLEARIQETERQKLLHTLATGLSHDLRNTLTGARLAIQVHGKSCQDDRESIDVAIRQLKLAEEQLVRWMRMSGEVENRSPVFFETILDQTVALVRPMADHYGSHLEVHIDSSSKQVLIPHSELLTSSLMNLLFNALHAAGSQGSVRLDVESKEGKMEIQVGDSGPGPSKEIQDRMFEPLVTSKPEGVGLGLAIVAKTMGLMNGEVLWRRENERTWFVMSIPIPNPS